MYGAKLILHGVSIEGRGVATLQLDCLNTGLLYVLYLAHSCLRSYFQPCEYSELSVIIIVASCVHPLVDIPPRLYIPQGNVGYLCIVWLYCWQ